MLEKKSGKSVHVCVGVTNFVVAPIKLLKSNHVHDKLNVNVN